MMKSNPDLIATQYLILDKSSGEEKIAIELIEPEPGTFWIPIRPGQSGGYICILSTNPNTGVSAYFGTQYSGSTSLQKDYDIVWSKKSELYLRDHTCRLNLGITGPGDRVCGIFNGWYLKECGTFIPYINHSEPDDPGIKYFVPELHYEYINFPEIELYPDLDSALDSLKNSILPKIKKVVWKNVPTGIEQSRLGFLEGDKLRHTSFCPYQMENVDDDFRYLDLNKLGDSWKIQDALPLVQRMGFPNMMVPSETDHEFELVFSGDSLDIYLDDGYSLPKKSDYILTVSESGKPGKCKKTRPHDFMELSKVELRDALLQDIPSLEKRLRDTLNL